MLKNKLLSFAENNDEEVCQLCNRDGDYCTNADCTFFFNKEKTKKFIDEIEYLCEIEWVTVMTDEENSLHMKETQFKNRSPDTCITIHV